MEQSRLPDEQAVETLFTQRLVRQRYIYWFFLALLLVMPFNGRWRMGLDSAIYRGVADNIAAGNGYKLGLIPEKQVYPGLPYLLAGIQKITGTNDPFVPLLLMVAMAGACLVIVYHLIQRRYPRWVAVVVTCGVGMNVRFVQQAHELMTDTPFMLGLLMSLLGWELLGESALSRSRRIGAILLLGVGLVIAATMRPTFWVLALAWGITCAWNLIRHRDKRSAIALAAGAVGVVLFALFDPRIRGLNFLKGGYERQLIHAVQSPRFDNLWNLIWREFNESFFNEPLQPLGPIAVLMLLIGTFLVSRRQLLWGLQVFILCGVTVMLSDAPRYFLMVLPTLWLAWVLILCKIVRPLPDFFKIWGLFAGFTLGNIVNIVSIVALTQVQHAELLAPLADRFAPLLDHYKLSHASTFEAAYKNGEYQPLVKFAGVLHDQMKPDEIAIGPHASLLTYLSGRTVIGARVMGMDTASLGKYPGLVQNYQPAPKYLIGPISYKDKDRPIGLMLWKGILTPGKQVREGYGFWLAQLIFNPPPAGVDWSKMPTVRPRPQIDAPPRRVHRVRTTAPTTGPTTGPATTPTTKRVHHAPKPPRPPTTAPATPLTPEQIRKIKRDRRAAAAAATQPTTKP